MQFLAKAKKNICMPTLNRFLTKPNQRWFQTKNRA